MFRWFFLVMRPCHRTDKVYDYACSMEKVMAEHNREVLKQYRELTGDFYCAYARYPHPAEPSVQRQFRVCQQNPHTGDALQQLWHEPILHAVYPLYLYRVKGHLFP